ncbi:MAG: HhH-GPD-type base excision DNA repair protein [Candidatus Nanopelagicales bacterium]
MTLCLAQDPPADELLSRDPFALLTGMLLDQQFPMERAFQGPYLLASRLGWDRLDPAALLGLTDEELRAAAAGPPAIHRYPQAMAARLRALAEVVVSEYGGDATAIWAPPRDGAQIMRALRALPGFGEQKARIFLALLGKQLGLAAPGWREATGAYGEQDSLRSVADVVDAESLARVRATKAAAKAAAKAGAS